MPNPEPVRVCTTISSTIADTAVLRSHAAGVRACLTAQLISAAMLQVPERLLVHLRRARDLADRRYADPLDLDLLAAAAGVSKYHFLRCFTATYGRTPALYLAERRIERAQDLLRATNLTVTEVCHLVGYTSLGSFSSRFTQLVGVSPSAYQTRSADHGAHRIPGCFVFMHGLSDRRPLRDRQKLPDGAPDSATSEKPTGRVES